MAGLFDDLLQDDVPSPARTGGGLFDDLLQDDAPTPAPRRRGGLRSEVQPYVAGQAPPVLEGEFAPPASAPVSILDTKQPGYGGTPADLVEQSKSPAQRAAEVSALRAPPPVLKAAPEPSLLRRGLDTTLRKPLDNSLGGLALETLGDAARGVGQASAGLGGSLWAGLQVAGRTVGSEDLEGFAGAAGREARSARDALTNRNDPGSLTQQIFASTFTSLPLAGALGAAGLPAMMAAAAADEYGQSRDKGVPHEAAAERAAVMGLAEGWGEQLGLPIVQRLLAGGVGKLTSKEFGKTVAELLVKEQVGEQATTALQDLYDAFGQYGERKGMTLAEYLTDVANTAKVTLGQSLLTAGIGGALARKRPKEPSFDARQAMLDRGFLTGDTAAPSPPPGRPDGGADGQAQARQAQEGLLNELPASPATPAGRPAGSPDTAPGVSQAAGAEAPTILDRVGVTRVGPSTITNEADDYADFTADAVAAERSSGAAGVAAGPVDSGVVPSDLARVREPGAAELAPDGDTRRPPVAAGTEGVAVRSDTGVAPLEVRPNRDGTAIVTGDPDTLGALTGNVRLTATSQGVLVGKTRAKEVQAAVEATRVPEAFGSKMEAYRFAVQQGLAKTTLPVESTAGQWVLQPTAQPRTIAELTGERRAFDRLVPALQGRLRGAGRVELVPDADVANAHGVAVGEFASAVRSAFRVPISFVRNSGVNGVYFEGRVYLDPDRLTSQGDFLPRLLGVTGHEVEHFYQESQDPADQQTNQVLEQTIRQYLRPGVLDQRAAAERKGLKGTVTDRYVFNEVAADLNGSMWLDSKFWGQLYDADKGSTARRVFFRFMQAATKLAGVLRGTTLDADRWVTNVEKVREAFVQAWAERNGRRTLESHERPQQRTGLPAASGAYGRVAREDGGDQGSPQVPRHGQPRDGAISVRGYHYSTAARTRLDGTYFGTGLGGAERERLGRGADPRLLQRVYFYVDKGQGVSPEAGVGGVRHSVDLLNIYDPASRLVQSKGNANDFELAVIAAGFDGYIARDFRTDEGAVVLLGPGSRAVPVARDDHTRAPLSEARAAELPPSRREGGELVSRTAPDIPAIKNAASVRATAPSFRFEYGAARVAEGEKEAANTALRGAGSRVSFKLDEPGPVQLRQNRDGTLTVTGDLAAIRSRLPEDIRGKPTKDGLVFTHVQAPRVKAILEGRQAAYSRGGHVLARKPMKDGRYVGAPPRFDTPAKVPTLRRWLKKLALEGEPGRFWYENSSEAILRYVGGDVAEARKLVALMAIYSPQAKVDGNTTMALRAWAQYKAGHPISAKDGAKDKKATEAMADAEGFWRKWTGEKTGNFATNLMSRIDPALVQGATVDMWMMRAAFYNHDAPTTTEYAFMEDETNRLADELGWEPQQVQAAIWVAVKARMEDEGVKRRTEEKSERKGFMHRDPEGNRVVPKSTETQHRAVWYAEAFKDDATPDNIADAKFDFSDGLRRHIGQISWEARPGRSTGILPGVNDAAYEDQVDFQQAVQKALRGPNGEDLLAQQLGLLVQGDLLAPGVWQSEVAAGMQTTAALAPLPGEDAAGKVIKQKGVDTPQKRTLDAYAAALGLLLRQEGVGWHRPFYKGRKADENGVELRAGRPFTPDEAKSLWSALDQEMRAAGHQDWENGAGMISSGEGMRVVNFGAVPDNGAFRKLVKKAAEADQLPAVDAFDFASDGDLITNDWAENPHGQGYRSRISEAGRPDLLGWLRSVLAPRVQAVFDQYAATHGWGTPGDLNALFDALERGDADQGPRASLSEEDPHARFDGVQVEQQVRIADTGEVATLRLDAGQALRTLADRRRMLQQLLGCLG